MTQFTLSSLRQNGLFRDVQSHILEAFWGFHTENPIVFDLFRAFSEDLLRAGRAQYGSKAIMERIRWHITVEVKGGDEFKINNNYSSCYARLLALVDPRFQTFFQMRSSA